MSNLILKTPLTPNLSKCSSSLPDFDKMNIEHSLTKPNLPKYLTCPKCKCLFSVHALAALVLPPWLKVTVYSELCIKYISKINGQFK